jgi:acetyl esterase/lipase
MFFEKRWWCSPTTSAAIHQSRLQSPKVKSMKTTTSILILTTAVLLATADGNQPKTKGKSAATAPPATSENVSYGPHPRNVLDFWKAESDKPTPVMFFIHGGGWGSGDKTKVREMGDLKHMLANGISVVSINYRLINKDAPGKESPPVKAPLEDAARALQFVRSKAGEWGLDKQRIGAAGGSAGACSSLWLAYHDDMADPASADPVARESTRLWCAALVGAQTTLDPQQMREWMPNSKYGGHAFGKKDFAEFFKDREEILPWIRQYSPYLLVSKDDPPVLISYKSAPAMGKDQGDPTHSANFGVGLKKRCDELGIDCHVLYPGTKDVEYKSTTDFLIRTLLASEEEARR